MCLHDKVGVKICLIYDTFKKDKEKLYFMLTENIKQILQVCVDRLGHYRKNIYNSFGNKTQKQT